MCIDAYSSTPFQFAPSVNQYFQLPDGIRPDSKAFDANGYVAVNGSGDGSSSSSGSFSTARSVNYGQIGADGKIYQSYSSAYYWKRVQITGVFPCEE